MTFSNGFLRLRIDVTGLCMLGAAVYFLITGDDAKALGFGVMSGLSGISFAIGGLREDLAERAGR